MHRFSAKCRVYYGAWYAQRYGYASGWQRCRWRRSLSTEAYRTRVEPILKKREGHTRCVVCLRRMCGLNLQPLAPGNAGYTEDQSRRNFENVSKQDAGQTRIEHSACTRWRTTAAETFSIAAAGSSARSDAEWKILAEWVRRQAYGTVTAPLRFGTSPTGMRVTSLRVAASIAETVFEPALAT